MTDSKILPFRCCGRSFWTWVGIINHRKGHGMTDAPNLDEIREHLAAAARNPDYWANDRGGVLMAQDRLVAWAPTWLHELCDEVERLRAVVLKQGEAIEHQRNHNHNVEQKRGNWRKKAEAWRACADQLANAIDHHGGSFVCSEWEDEDAVTLVVYERLKGDSR